MIRRLLLLLMPLLVCACSKPAPLVEQTGTMPGGGTIVVANAVGDIDAFAPGRGEPSDSYTIAAYGSGPPPAIVRRGPLITVRADRPGLRFLVRGPKGGAMNLTTGRGYVSVQDFEGVVNAHADRGDIKMLIPQYGNASVGTGTISVIFASTDWPGTLHFTAQNGTVELYVNENARARVRLHTGNGTVYSDFPLRGTSAGSAETIDAAINGGGPRSIDVEVARGSIRLMQLKPQI